MFQYVQYESNDNVIKYYGSVILHIYELWKIWRATNFQGRDKLIFQSMNPNEFSQVSHTIGCKTPLGTVC